MNYKQKLRQADSENKREKAIEAAYKRAKQQWDGDILETSIALDEAKDKLEAARIAEPLLSADVLSAKREVTSLELGLKELKEEYDELFSEEIQKSTSTPTV